MTRSSEDLLRELEEATRREREADPPDSDPGDWPEPVRLGGGPRPVFPLAALPPIVRDQVEAVAESMQVPIDLAAGVALGVLSAAAGHIVAEVKSDWQEPLAVYVCVVAESGEGKGPVVKAMSAPLEALERERIEEAREGVAIGQARFDTLEQRLKQARTAARRQGRREAR